VGHRYRVDLIRQAGCIQTPKIHPYHIFLPLIDRGDYVIGFIMDRFSRCQPGPFKVQADFYTITIIILRSILSERCSGMPWPRK
jgi:hypothetical protein